MSQRTLAKVFQVLTTEVGSLQPIAIASIGWLSRQIPSSYLLLPRQLTTFGTLLYRLSRITNKRRFPKWFYIQTASFPLFYGLRPGSQYNLDCN